MVYYMLMNNGEIFLQLLYLIGLPPKFINFSKFGKEKKKREKKTFLNGVSIKNSLYFSHQAKYTLFYIKEHKKQKRSKISVE